MSASLPFGRHSILLLSDVGGRGSHRPSTAIAASVVASVSGPSGDRASLKASENGQDFRDHASGQSAGVDTVEVRDDVPTVLVCCVDQVDTVTE
jgi:hypothetical protein